MSIISIIKRAHTDYLKAGGELPVCLLTNTEGIKSIRRTLENREDQDPPDIAIYVDSRCPHTGLLSLRELEDLFCRLRAYGVLDAWRWEDQ